MNSTRPALLGLLSSAALLGAYFALLAALSGWSFAMEQFRQFWGYVLALSAGFGLQVALFVRLRAVVRQPGSRAVVAASGTTSTAAMISCCTHYLANVAPIVGAAGVVTFVAQYQIELFWTGLAFNAAGIAYIGSKLHHALREHAKCVAA